MSVDQRAYWVWLQHALGAGSSKQNRILSSYRTLNDFYAAGMESWLLEGYFTQNELGKLGSFSVNDAEALIEYCEKIGQKVVTPDCKTYPEPLRQIHNAPCALYVKGTLPDFSAMPSIAIVGTRKATATGAATARSFAFELAKQGTVVVSGGALGIDTAAHKGALQADGKTVCVLGCGIDYNYLMGNAPLREAIAVSGAVVSEYPPNTQAVNSNFPIRNRIISGLTLGTLVVEAAGRSGSLITAQYALEQGRDVFAVPSGIYSPVSQGVNGLIKSGAKPVSNAGEILEEYLYRFPGQIDLNDADTNVILSPEPVPEAEAAAADVLDAAGFSEDAALLYSCLAGTPRHISELERRTGIPTPRILTAVTELELAGKIRSHSGRRYSLPG
ncbi:DNA-processing protein DprA [Caproiciproducens sp.]|uniref:DNA-processing protein DprA n=1 Tax=Caproiciproducens sp. TaxID=1954376 RepID=UPI00289DB44C|nr:DNA-processing protein DprA [Caproiciproducens sp.]